MLCSIERLAPQVFAEEKHGPKRSAPTWTCSAA